MSSEIIKNGVKYPIGVIPQNYPASNIKMANGESVEDAHKWKLLGTSTGTSTPISFPTDFEELVVKVKIPYQDYDISMSLHLTKIQLTGAVFYDSGAQNTWARIYVDSTNRYLILNFAGFSDVDYSQTTEISVYYR